MPKLKKVEIGKKRVNGSHMDSVREKIKASLLVGRLTDMAMGTQEANPTQVAAAKALLNKVLPDLKAVEMSGSVDVALTPELLEWMGDSSGSP